RVDLGRPSPELVVAEPAFGAERALEEPQRTIRAPERLLAGLAVAHDVVVLRADVAVETVRERLDEVRPLTGARGLDSIRDRGMDVDDVVAEQRLALES